MISKLPHYRCGRWEARLQNHSNQVVDCFATASRPGERSTSTTDALLHAAMSARQPKETAEAVSVSVLQVFFELGVLIFLILASISPLQTCSSPSPFISPFLPFPQ